MGKARVLRISGRTRDKFSAMDEIIISIFEEDFKKKRSKPKDGDLTKMRRDLPNIILLNAGFKELIDSDKFNNSIHGRMPEGEWISYEHISPMEGLNQIAVSFHCGLRLAATFIKKTYDY